MKLISLPNQLFTTTKHKQTNKQTNGQRRLSPEVLISGKNNLKVFSRVVNRRFINDGYKTVKNQIK
jgi:hypothetical protein